MHALRTIISKFKFSREIKPIEADNISEVIAAINNTVTNNTELFDEDFVTKLRLEKEFTVDLCQVFQGMTVGGVAKLLNRIKLKDLPGRVRIKFKLKHVYLNDIIVLLQFVMHRLEGIPMLAEPLSTNRGKAILKVTYNKHHILPAELPYECYNATV